ncbi:MAG: efflux RND transporter periplasmic adaptor subunit [Longimicrobiales bacterium]
MKRNPIRIVAPLVLIGGAVALYFLLTGDDSDAGVIIAAGTVEATEADIGFQTGGRISEVLVAEGDRITAGQVLARLDQAELGARLSAAEAQVEVARAQLAELRRGPRPEEVAQARAVVAAAAQRLENARTEAGRAQRLFDGGAISRQALDQATTQRSVLEAQHAQAREQLLALERGTRTERIAASAAQLEQAEASAEQVEAVFAYAIARAPWAGLVSTRHREPGETVPPGTPVVSVLNPDDRWIRVYIGEADLSRISIGQEVAITADGLPDARFAGRIEHIAEEAEFTPRNVQTPEERSRLVYAVKVRVLEDPELRLKPGMPADVHVQVADTAPAGEASS